MKIRYMIFLALAMLLFATACGTKAQDPAQPNVVFIVADYMGYSDIGPYGATDIQTPSLDRIAQDGARFSSYYSASPVCGPSRAALLSGFYPARVGMESNINPDHGGLSASDSTLVRELKAARYRTAIVGKWHLGRSPGFSPLSHGFDTFFGFHSWTLGYHDHLTSSGEPGLYRGDELVTEEGYLTEILTTEAIRFIETKPDSPFFLYLAYNAALPPFQGPDLPKSQWATGWDVDEAGREDYVAMVEAMDDGIGRVLSKLEEQNLTENTLVIFTYDHGGRHLSRSDPLFHGFGTLWEGGIRVPLLMKWPSRFSGGQHIERPTIAMDLTATMLAATGRNPDSLKLDGSSLLPLLQNTGDVASPPLFWRFGKDRAQMKAVRNGNWKYVVDQGTQMLFNLESDLGERKDQFSTQTDVARRLRENLIAWEQSIDGVE